ncbi:ATP-binding cassette domain-containing protein [Pannonibacter sp. Pt2-lr]
MFDQVSLKRGDKTVLEGLSLTLSERRIALIGLNGSGKSSFVRLLNGLLLPDSGTLQIYGADTRQARANLPRHVGFVFQNPDHQAIFPTVEEEIAFGLTQLGQSGRTPGSMPGAFWRPTAALIWRRGHFWTCPRGRSSLSAFWRCW